MPMSGGFSGRLTGLNLKAWVLINPVTGAIIKNSGISTVNRTLTGTWVITFSSAMASTNYIASFSNNNDVLDGVMQFQISAKSTTSITVKNMRYVPAVGNFEADGQILHIEFFE